MNSLSIIILHYNTYELTRDCLTSIYNSRINNIDLEIVVVDNGSSESDEARLIQQFKEIKYVRIGKNLGFAKGNNVGLLHATKAFILLLNSDTVITDADTFEKTIAVVKAYNNRVILSTRLLTVNGEPQVAYGPIPNLQLEFLQTTFLYKFLSRKYREDSLISFAPNNNRMISSGYVAATYLLFHREAIEVLPNQKLYDDTFLYGEELFWSSTWMSHGFKMYYYADVSIRHLVGQSSRREAGNGLTVRRAYQSNAEKNFLLWRYNIFIVSLIYVLRVIRFVILSPFDSDIRLRLKVFPKSVLATKVMSRND